MRDLANWAAKKVHWLFVFFLVLFFLPQHHHRQTSKQRAAELFFLYLFVSQDIEFAFQCQKALFSVFFSNLYATIVVKAKKKNEEIERDRGKFCSSYRTPYDTINSVVTDWIISWFELCNVRRLKFGEDEFITIFYKFEK